MRLSDDNLRGRTVIGADGRAIGEIAALFVRSEEWKIESLLVTLRRDVADDLGASRSMFHRGTVEIPTSAVQSVGDAVVLAIPVQGLRGMLPATGESATH